MRIKQLLKSDNPKYNKPDYLSEIYDAKDGKGRYKEILKSCIGSDSVKSSKINTEGGQIYVFKAGKGTNKRLLLTSGLHGNESIGPKVSSMFLSLKKIPSDTSVMVIPVMNPDGFIGAHRRDKTNSDPNRSFNKDSKTYDKLLKAILEFNPTICVDLHEFHENDGAFVYTNMPSIKNKLNKIFKASNMPVTKKKEITGDKVISGMALYNKKDKDDGTLISWLHSKGYKYILPESIAEADPWSQITFLKLIIDLALTV
jgi:hypothetical protein